MNRWGVAGCQEHRDAILARLRQKSAEATWAMKITAAIGAAQTGLAAKVNWLDPAPGILDEAIRIVLQREASSEQVQPVVH